MWWCFLPKKSSPIPALTFFMSNFTLSLFAALPFGGWKLWKWLSWIDLLWILDDFIGAFWLLQVPRIPTFFGMGESMGAKRMRGLHQFFLLVFRFQSSEHGTFRRLLWRYCLVRFFVQNPPHLFGVLLIWIKSEKIILNICKSSQTKVKVTPIRLIGNKAIVPFEASIFESQKPWFPETDPSPVDILYGETMVGRLTTRKNG